MAMTRPGLGGGVRTARPFGAPPAALTASSGVPVVSVSKAEAHGDYKSAIARLRVSFAGRARVSTGRVV